METPEIVLYFSYFPNNHLLLFLFRAVYRIFDALGVARPPGLVLLNCALPLFLVLAAGGYVRLGKCVVRLPLRPA